MELESAIQELISRLEFVSLPGFGSFVKKYEPASPSADGKSFNPPREFFTFDSSRIFNDEALENYICQTTNVDHKKASAIVAQYVQDIKSKLSAGVDIGFEGIGVLKQNEKGVIELIPSNSISSRTFGLGKVEVEPKTAEKKKAETTTPVKKVEVKTTFKADVVAKPAAKVKSKTSIFVPIIVIFALIAIVAVVLFVPELRFWETATTNDTEIIAQADEEANTSEDDFATPFDSTDIESNVTIEPDTLPAVVEQTSTSEIKTTTAVTDKKVALYYQETKQGENKTFYIIAGSFSQEVNAQKLIQDLSAKGYKPLLIQNNNMYRVAIYKFTNRDRALRELERLKSQKISDKVWLLTL